MDGFVMEKQGLQNLEKSYMMIVPGKSVGEDNDSHFYH